MADKNADYVNTCEACGRTESSDNPMECIAGEVYYCEKSPACEAAAVAEHEYHDRTGQWHEGLLLEAQNDRSEDA